jgi:hypothetical protein
LTTNTSTLQKSGESLWFCSGKMFCTELLLSDENWC